MDFVAPSNEGFNEVTTTDVRGIPGRNIDNGGQAINADYDSTFGGTSSSAPLAAGAAALLLTGYPEITRDDVLDILRASCAQIGGVAYPNGRHAEYGFGRVSASGALQLAGSLPVITAPTPTAVLVGTTLVISGNQFYGNVNPALAGGQSLFAALTPAAGGTATSLNLTKTSTLNGVTGLNAITLSGVVPASLPGGSYHLAVTSPAGQSANYSITLTTPEILVEQPAGSEIVDGGLVAFDSSPVNTGVVRTFTIRNTGMGSLTGVTLSRDGSHFGDFSISALSPASSTISPGSSATFMVTFTPSAAGLRSAVLHINSSDGDESPYDISLSGTGLARVTNVTSSSANGYYDVGAVIPINVTFTDPVDVTDFPTLALNSGGTATYVSGSGGLTLTFNYSVEAGQNAGDLDYTSASALSLSGGTITSAGGNDAALTLPAPGAASSLGANKSLIIDTSIPVATISPPVGTHTKTAILFTINFSEPVIGMATADVTITGGTKSTFTPVSSTSYTVAVTSPAQGLVTCTLANNAATDNAGHPSAGTYSSVTYDTVVPTITISAPSPTAANSAGSIQYTVTYGDLNFDESTLAAGNITVTATGTAAAGGLAVSGTGNVRTVTLSNPTGNGTLNITLAAGTGSDLAGNLALTKTGTAATIDNTAPTVTTSSALLAANANSVIIAGTGFSAVEANNTVTFNNGAEGTVTLASGTSLTVAFSTRPQEAGPLTATVTDLAGNTSALATIRTVRPVVTANTATIDATETSIIINGFGFSSTTNSVTFSGAALTGTYTATYNSPTTISVDGILNLMPGALSAVVTSNGVVSGAAVQVASVALPADMVGRFVGVVERVSAVNGGHGGILDLTVASNGTLTGTVKFGSQSASFAGSVSHNDDFTIERALSIAALTNYAVRDTVNLKLVCSGSDYWGTAADSDFKKLTLATAVAQTLNNPRGIVVAADGTRYIAETGRHHILKVDLAGVVTVFAGVSDTAGNADGAPGVGLLNSPWGLALDAATNTLWVADSGNNSVRQIDTVSGDIRAATTVTAITGLSQPVGVALNSTNVFVLERGAHRIKKRAKTGGTVAVLAGSTTGVPGNTTTTFDTPEGLAINAAGTFLFVADTGNHCIRRVSIPASGLGTVLVWSGAFDSPEDIEGLPGVARFKSPTAVAVDAEGGVWVADTGNLALKLIASSGVTSEHLMSNAYNEVGIDMNLRSLAVASDGVIHAGEDGVGVKTAVETADDITAGIPFTVPKDTDPIPAAGRINTFLGGYAGTGNSYTRPDGTEVQWGSGYASFVTATAHTYSMAGRLPDGSSVTASGIIGYWAVPFHAMYTPTGSAWQASVQGSPVFSLIMDPAGGVKDVQQLEGSAYDTYMRKTPEPTGTASTNELDAGLPEWSLDLYGLEYRNLAYYNQSMFIDPATSPNATFYAEVYSYMTPWDFYVDQPVRFTTTTITEPTPNTNALALGLDAATGIVTGSFTPPGTAPATLNAILVPYWGGAGNYLMGGVMNGPASFGY